MNKSLIIFSLFISLLFLSGCTSKDIKKCNGVEYNASLAHCVQTCADGIPNCNMFGHNDYWRLNNEHYISLNPNYCYAGEPSIPCMDDYVKTFEQDRIDKENADRQAKLDEEIALNKTRCYNSGKFYNYTFDIIDNYNLSCERIAYINDHLIDSTRQVDGGYISGSYRGFVSYGEIEGHLYQYVTEGVLATGTLVKNIQYHLDCNNSTLDLSEDTICDNPCGDNCCINGYFHRIDTKKISYYSESDFVMYYVQRCLN